jgi:hypothetical protein
MFQKGSGVTEVLMPGDVELTKSHTQTSEVWLPLKTSEV